MHYWPKCDREVDTEVRRIKETWPIKGENIEIVSNVRFCKVCGEDIWDDKLDGENLKNAFDKYRKIHNIPKTHSI